ncbi:hypothetical protein V8G54_007668 [Vigna mungo]|uniref:HMA domain-containing protein n=1 Tax=Vigna mungo TaxID=3915 RepID=A0AAQ3P3S9_VIGMU
MPHIHFSFSSSNSSILSILQSFNSSFNHYFHFPLSMDAKPPQLAAQPLNYQTWFLKVSIHCEGCRRKVKKVLKSIDGVFTATIDPQQNKVTVTGSVAVETLLRKLVRAGKQAEIWPENDGKISINGRQQQKKKKNEAREPQRVENHNGTENASAKCNSEKKSSSIDSPVKSPSVYRMPSEGGRSEGGAGSGKKKKKKLHSGGGNGNSGLSSVEAATGEPAHTGLQFQDLVGPVNVNPTRQYLLLYPESGVAAYNRLYPSYYVPSSPYTWAGVDQDYHHFQSPPLVSFEIFSDENVNGCSVM